MIVTQFGFFGFALQNPRYFALTNEPDENWEGLLHFWRTIGYLLGIDERYSLFLLQIKLYFLNINWNCISINLK